MKFLILVFLILYNSGVAFTQVKVSKLRSIKDQIEIIDMESTSMTISLDPEEFLTQIADHGAELNGYYDHDRLKKMVRNIGMPTAMVITTFYYWNDNVIYVNYKQQEYMQQEGLNGSSSTDYSKKFTKFEAHYYFDNGKEINKKLIGIPLDTIELGENFVSYGLRMKKLLDNKYVNKELYQTLQGKWVNIESSGDFLMFDETMQIVFREGRFYQRQRVKINGDVMVCTSIKDKYVYKYKIKSINEKELILQDLQNKSSIEMFKYRKEYE